MFTGGHMTPALAVLAELTEAGGYDFVWVGQKYNQVGATDTSPEYKTVSKLRVKFIDLRSGKLVRSWNRSPRDFLLAITNLLRIPWGFIKGLFIVLKERPDVVATFGGYLAMPIAFWGRIFGAKVLLHEQTVITGVSNKYLSKLAHTVCISWESSAKYYPVSKTVFTGNPIRKEIFAIEPKIHFDNDLPTIYITGGNQGSFVLNKAVIFALNQLLDFTNIIHQTGEVIDTLELLNTLPSFKDKTGKYMHRPYFFGSEMGAAMNQADLIISRSGANTVTELLALGKMSILVPIPWVTKNEQFLNAKVIQSTGLGEIINQIDLTPETLVEKVKLGLAQLNQQQNWLGNDFAASRTLAMSKVRINSAELISAEIAKLVS